MTLNDARIKELLDIDDPVGIISIYVGIMPEQAGGVNPGWAIAVRNELRDLQSDARENRPHAEWTAIEKRIDGLGRDLDRLLDGSQHGRGRALFAPVCSDRVETVAVQVPFADRAILDRNAYIRPLVAAVDEGRPAGIVAITKRGIRVLEWRLGEAEEMERDEFSIGGRLWRKKSGPAPAQPQDTRPGGQRRDAFEERVDENRLRFMRESAHTVAEIANERGWDRLIVSGDSRISKPFADELNPAGGEQLHITDLSWDEEAPNTIAEQAWDMFKVLRRERAESLMDDVRNRALAGGAGALGLPETLESLNQGRVDVLLFDGDVQVSGYRSAEGYLYADDQRPQAEAQELQEERFLVERIIERALETDATVVPIEHEVALPLQEHGGIAALLRW